jgi:D-sedoheptulose 7-phosphate isomerase
LADSLQRGIAAVSLCSNPALITAILNDQGEEFVFAQQVVGLGAEGDILIGFSTSGNSKNIINAFITARAKQIRTIGITGHSGGELKNYCDILINVPEIRTAWIQELHLPVYHAVCRMVEKELFD